VGVAGGKKGGRMGKEENKKNEEGTKIRSLEGMNAFG